MHRPSTENERVNVVMDIIGGHRTKHTLQNRFAERYRPARLVYMRKDTKMMASRTTQTSGARVDETPPRRIFHPVPLRFSHLPWGVGPMPVPTGPAESAFRAVRTPRTVTEREDLRTVLDRTKRTSRRASRRSVRSVVRRPTPRPRSSTPAQTSPAESDVTFSDMPDLESCVSDQSQEIGTCTNCHLPLPGTTQDVTCFDCDVEPDVELPVPKCD